MLELYEKGEISDVKGFITTDFSEVPSDLPSFQRDEVEEILNFIISQFTIAPIKTLILAGGKSSRMGEDKGKLQYHGDFQTKSLVKLMQRYTNEVYVSIRPEQVGQEHVTGIETITDAYPSTGPSSGILSAMNLDSDAAWLVVAVDLPYLTEKTLNQLLEKRNPFKLATCFKNPEKGWPEPLCTIWEPKSRLKLHQFMGMDRNCPRKILFNSEINLLELEDINALDNCNTQEEYRQALKDLEVRI